MDAIQALILGVVQGLTEWLPVSSSGHLVLLQEAWGLDTPILFDILLHVATALVVLVFMRKEVLEIFRSLVRFTRRWRTGEKAMVVLREEDGAMTAWLIVVGTIPTALIGFGFRSWIEPLFHSVLTVAVGLIITGIVLSFTYPVRNRGSRSLKSPDGLAIGVMQGIAIIPGISRSGLTISTGLLLGAERVKVARYSFLLAVPAILGVALAESFSIGPGGLNADPLALVIALSSTIISALLALKVLLLIISKAKLYAFTPYCLAVGIALLLWIWL